MDERKDEQEPVILTEDNVEVLPASSDWQSRHKETKQRKEDLHAHYGRVKENIDQANQYFRPAKPAPSVDDGEHKTVAVYARVSTASEEQISSIENQTLYYTKKIEDSQNWDLQEIYSDEGKSGTSMRHRDEFKRMIQNAKLKKMDMIICASVSRFARNVSDCLEQVAELKTMNPSHPVGVYFETENIYTLNPDSDQALGLHALLADWESANKSRRMILSYDQRILTGQYPVADLMGYRHTKDGRLVIVPEEAKTIRFIYLAFISGYSMTDIADILTEKQRATMRGRQEWNSSMVANIMQNERRWGDLEARKYIVVNYKKGKVARNNDDRCSAYVPDHHEAIVSPAVARAAKCITKSSVKHSTGYAALTVITDGGLKGFVNVVPSWGGVDNDTFHVACRSVYETVELNELHNYMELMNGNQHSNIIQMGLSGYHVPYGVGYLTSLMPSLTVSKNNIVFNKACHKRIDAQYIEMYYHPILQAIIIRESNGDSECAIAWEKEDGSVIKSMPSKAFSRALYENMCWKKDYNFRFRGITKERNGVRIMFFFLDEPQIILGKKQKEELEADRDNLSAGTAYIPYKEEPEENAESKVTGAVFGYPEEWNHSIGMSYELRCKRDYAIGKITDQDILKEGMAIENPLIGHIPTKQEIEEELEQLLVSM